MNAHTPPRCPGPVAGFRAIRAAMREARACRERSAATELIDLSQLHMQAAAEHADSIVDVLAEMERQGQLRAIEEFLTVTYGG